MRRWGTTIGRAFFTPTLRRSSKSKEVTVAREHALRAAKADGSLEAAMALHVDDLSSDDEEAGNTIGRVPLRWYEPPPARAV